MKTLFRILALSLFVGAGAASAHAFEEGNYTWVERDEELTYYRLSARAVFSCEKWQRGSVAGFSREAEAWENGRRVVGKRVMGLLGSLKSSGEGRCVIIDGTERNFRRKSVEEGAGSYESARADLDEVGEVFMDCFQHFRDLCSEGFVVTYDEEPEVATGVSTHYLIEKAKPQPPDPFEAVH